MTDHAANGLADASAGPHERGEDALAARYRYGAVFILVSIVAVYTIVAPDGVGSRALGFTLTGIALLVAVSTSRARTMVRRRRAAVGGVAILVVAIGILAGVVPKGATFVLDALLTVAIPVTLVRGLLALVRDHGAGLQAVAGGLAIYLLTGLTFASIVGFVAAVGPSPYFSQGLNGTASEHVYYSFTVLTTTGFGDLTAGHQVGRALAVTEMLVGQLYLVTVISLLIGRRVGQTQ